MRSAVIGLTFRIFSVHGFFKLCVTSCHVTQGTEDNKILMAAHLNNNNNGYINSYFDYSWLHIMVFMFLNQRISWFKSHYPWHGKFYSVLLPCLGRGWRPKSWQSPPFTPVLHFFPSPSMTLPSFLCGSLLLPHSLPSVKIFLSSSSLYYLAWTNVFSSFCERYQILDVSIPF